MPSPPELARWRWATTAAFGLGGITVSAWGPRLPAIKEDLDISTATIGLLLAGVTVGAVLGLLASTPLRHWLGGRGAIAGATGVIGAAMAVLGLALIARSLPLLAAAFVVTGAGVGLLDVLINVEGSAVERAAGRSLMPSMHAAWSIGAAVGSGIGAACAALDITPAAQLIGEAVLIAAAGLATAPGIPAEQRDAAEEDAPASAETPAATDASRRDRGAKLRQYLRGWLDWRLLLIGLVMLGVELGEGSANSWLTLAVKNNHGQTAAVAALFFTVFATCEGLSRIFAGPVVDRLGRVRAVQVTATLGVAGITLFILTGNRWLVLLGVVLWAVGVSLGFPLGTSAAGQSGPDPVARISVVSSIGYFANLAGPPAIGALAESAGLLNALWVIAAFFIAAFAAAGSLRPVPAAAPETHLGTGRPAGRGAPVADRRPEHGGRTCPQPSCVRGFLGLVVRCKRWVVGSSERLGIGSVFRWYRQRLTFTRWGNRQPTVVPRRYAGWVIAGEGEPADADGFRPLGQVRSELIRLVRMSPGVSPRERDSVLGVWGLAQWPDLDSARPLTRRITVERVRTAGSARKQALTPERVHQLAGAALEHLERVAPERPGRSAVEGCAVSDPVWDPWFQDFLAAGDADAGELIGLAADHIRSFCAVGGESASVNGLLAEVEAYLRGTHRALTAGKQARRGVGTSRARAAVSVFLWEAVAESRLTGRQPGKQAAGSARSLFHPAEFGLLRPPQEFSTVSACVSELLGGNGCDEVLRAVAGEGLRLCRAGDQPGARVVSDLLLAKYPVAGRPRVKAETAARILHCAADVRSRDEDWSAVSLAFSAFERHPRSWYTVGTAISAVRVASAQGRWTVADKLCELADTSLRQGIDIPANRHPVVEAAEYQFWVNFHRTATLRRLIEAHGQEISGQGLKSAIRRSRLAEQDFEKALKLNSDAARGDISPAWLHYVHVRQAELHLLASDAATGGDRAVQRRAAALALERADALQRDFQAGFDKVAVAKARLGLALRAGEQASAAGLLTELHREHRWPLHRTLPEIVLALNGRAPAWIGKGLRDHILGLVAAERTPGWSPAVDDASRRRMLAAGSPAVS